MRSQIPKSTVWEVVAVGTLPDYSTATMTNLKHDLVHGWQRSSNWSGCCKQKMLLCGGELWSSNSKVIVHVQWLPKVGSVAEGRALPPERNVENTGTGGLCSVRGKAPVIRPARKASFGVYFDPIGPAVRLSRDLRLKGAANFTTYSTMHTYWYFNGVINGVNFEPLR
eukprot:m.377988 g.377988  ORF g.377988 m.377988 type:complete len:168 (-) comp28211_c1_seq5:1441-1944(-)